MHPSPSTIEECARLWKAHGQRPPRDCAGTESVPDDTHQPTYPTWTQRVREVPDMLIAAQLSLGALATGESVATSVEARRIVRDACDLLRVALSNLVEGTRSAPD